MTTSGKGVPYFHMRFTVQQLQLTSHSIRGSTGRDCFPKMAPACIRKVYCLYEVSSY